MIKNFEDFVLECYGNSLNEAFQSNKLRELIKKHGKPKYGSDYKILYDKKDKYIIDIIDSPFLSDEQKEEYESKNAGKKIREINLEDETTIVLALTNEEDNRLYPSKRKSPYGGDAYFIGSRNSYAEERHKGNLGKNGGDKIRDKHMENVDKIKRRKLADKLHSSIPKIIDEIKSIIRDIEIEDDHVSDYVESEITLNGEKYTLIVNYEGYFSERSRKGGVADCEISITITDFDIWTEDGYTHTTNEDLGVTEKTHKDLFKEHIFDYESIYDEAEAVGIDGSYFMSR